MSVAAYTLERPVRHKSRSKQDLLERRQAAVLQRAFLPDMPSKHGPGLTFTSFFQPVKRCL